MRVQLMALAILAFSISVNHVFCQNDCYGLYEKEIAIDELKTWHDPPIHFDGFQKHRLRTNPESPVPIIRPIDD